MIGATPIIHALGGGPLRLVSAGALSGGLALTRASVALAAGTDGATMLSYAANAPRFQGAAQRLLVEGQRTNYIDNPGWEGARTATEAGNATGTVPTNVSSNLIGTSNGVSFSLVGRGTEFGLPYIDLRVDGTCTATGVRIVPMANYLNAPAAVGQTWCGSQFIRSVAGTPKISLQLELRPADSAGASLTGSSITAAYDSAHRRFSIVAALSPTGMAYQRLQPRFNYTQGVTYAETIRLYCPMLEFASFPSSPILPPTGTTGIATRAADAPAFTLSTARGSIIGTFMLPSVGTTSADQQGLLVLHDGTDSNRFGLSKPGGAATLQPFRSISGTLTWGSSIQTLAPGVAFRAALAWDASGVVACCNGGAVASLAGALPAVNRLLVGHGASTLGQGAFGEVGPLDLHPTRLPDATLQALTLN